MLLLIAGLLAACGGQQPAAVPAAQNTPAPQATEPPPTDDEDTTNTEDATEDEDATAAADEDATAAADEDATAAADEDDEVQSDLATKSDDTSVWYEHPSEMFGLQLPVVAEIVDETDEGVDILLDEDSLLFVYYYEADPDLSSDTIDEEVAWVLDIYVEEDEVISEYDVTAAEELDDMLYAADFSYTSEEYEDGDGKIVFTQEGETVYFLLLVSADIEEIEPVWEMAVESLEVYAADEEDSDQEDSDQEDSVDMDSISEGVGYDHPSEMFSLSLPTTAEIVGEIDEGVEVQVGDQSLLMIFTYEANPDLSDDTIEDEVVWVMDEYVTFTGLVSEYELAQTESLGRSTYGTGFSYTSEDYADGNGILVLSQQDDTVFLIALLADNQATFESVWALTAETFTTEYGTLDDYAQSDAMEDEEDAMEDEEAETDAGPAEEPDDSAAAPAPDGKTWLIMLYADADDQVLEEDMFIDVNEIERIGSSDRVQVVVQLDRFDGAFDGDGDWTSTRRYYLTQDDDLSAINSEMLEDLGEVNMAEGDTLTEFVTWATEAYPADEYVLILSDHGAGWPGGWNDPDPDEPGRHGTILDSEEDTLLLMEFEEALANIQEQTDIEQFTIIGFDACLMAHLEVFTAVAPYAAYSVASQETEPAMGWAYASFLEALVDNPDMEGDELARIIVESYIDQDIRIVDDDARTAFLTAMGAKPTYSAEEVAQHFASEITLSAIDLDAIPAVNTALDTMVELMMDINQKDVAAARTYAQAFEHVFGDKLPSSYIDLGSFSKVLVQESEDETIANAAADLQAAISEAVILERHGEERAGATGISIYFPNSRLYQAPYGGYDLYSTVASRFSDETLWDNYLAYHYTGQEITDLSAAIVDSRSTFVAPGASELFMTPLMLSTDVVGPEDTITIETDITGEQISYIYSYVAYYDEESDSYLSVDMDYVDIGETIEIGGVYYPDWGDEGLILEYEWEPVIYEISDGTTSTFALLVPESFGLTAEDAMYTTEGIYTFADSDEQRYAELVFDGEGALVKVLVFSNVDGTGAPRQIVPNPGDTFTTLMEWIETGEDGEDEEYVYEEGDTLTFGDVSLTWEEVIAPAGEYLVGFIAEDFDGNSYEEYAFVTVTE
jgi:hypothetical protein